MFILVLLNVHTRLHYKEVCVARGSVRNVALNNVLDFLY